MTSLDAKLFTWYRLQTECEAARAQLNEAMGAAADDVVLRLHAELERLRADSERVLKEIDALRALRAEGGAA